MEKIKYEKENNKKFHKSRKVKITYEKAYRDNDNSRFRF